MTITKQAKQLEKKVILETAEFNVSSRSRRLLDGARSDPNSANSQFFICFDDARFLDNKYTAWGEVIEGMENVDYGVGLKAKAALPLAHHMNHLDAAQGDGCRCEGLEPLHRPHPLLDTPMICSIRPSRYWLWRMRIGFSARRARSPRRFSASHEMIASRLV